MLDEVGISCRTENDFIYVFKDFVVVMKRVKKNGSYIMLGKTVLDANDAYIGLNVGKTVLWHNKLGHMSKKMYVLLA